MECRIKSEEQFLANVELINLLSKYDLTLRRLIRNKNHSIVLACNKRQGTKLRFEINSRKLENIIKELDKVLKTRKDNRNG